MMGKRWVGVTHLGKPLRVITIVIYKFIKTQGHLEKPSSA